MGLALTSLLNIPLVTSNSSQYEVFKDKVILSLMF